MNSRFPLLLCLVSTLVGAQSFPDATRDMTPRQREIFMRNAILGAQMREIDERNAADQQAVRDYQLTRDMRLMLAGEWKGLGLTDAESAEVAGAYKLTDRQDLVTRRIRREGVTVAVDQARIAYKAFDYQLADEYVVAAKIVIHELSAQKQPEPQKSGQ